MEITQELLREYFDYKDGSLYCKKKSAQRSVIGKKFGKKDAGGYIRGVFSRKHLLEHRLIFLLHHGYLPKFIDHINRDTCDNRIENLREATHSQNMCNSTMYQNNTTGFKGVSFDKQHGNYRAQLRVNGTSKYLGRFDTPELAHVAYCDAAHLYHAEFSCTS